MNVEQGRSELASGSECLGSSDDHRPYVSPVITDCEARYRRLVEQIPAVTYTAALDSISTTLYVSPQVERVLGYRPDEYTADPERWIRSVHVEDRQRVLDALRECHNTGLPFSQQYRVYHRDGRERWVSDQASIIHDASGRRLYLQGVLYDITDQKQIEQSLVVQAQALDQLRGELERLVEQRTKELQETVTQLQHEITHRFEMERCVRESESRFRVQYKNNPIPTLTWQHRDNGFFLIDYNNAVDKLVSHKLKPFLGKDARQFYHDRPDIIKDLESCFSRQRNIRRETEYQRRSTGDNRYVSLTYTFVPHDLVLMHIDDHSERRMAQEQLNHSRHMAAVGTLAAGIAHEINNPLGAMLIAAQVAIRQIEQMDGSGNIREMLQLIIKSVQRCSHIVKNILQLARSGQSVKQQEDLHDIVYHARDMVYEIIGSRAVRIQFDLSPGEYVCMVNAVEVEQVLVNLLHNAVESEADLITVDVQRMEGVSRVRISVIDNGHGMSSQQQEKAFDPFYTTRRDAGGSGLGLSIAHAVVVDHGGTLQLRSRAEDGGGSVVGRGTIVSFDLGLVDMAMDERDYACESTRR